MNEATLAVDPNVKIPAAVKAAAARSEELFKTMRDQPPEEVTQEGNPPADPAQDAAQMAQDMQDAQNSGQELQGALGAQDGEQGAQDEDQTWEHKFRSAQGRLVRQGEEMSRMAEQISSLQQVIATMQTAPRADATPLPELIFEDLTEEEAADYGEDFLKVVSKKARAEMKPVLDPLLRKISELEDQLKGVNGHVQQGVKEKFFLAMDEKLPDWRSMNTNPAFIEWLGLPDPYSGVIRQNMLNEAYAQGNVPRVLAFFNGFLAEEAVVAPAGKQPDPTRTTVQKVPLESLAAPGRAKSAAPAPAPAEKPIFTRAQISSFYADVAAGRYKDRTAEKNRLEAQIFEATREGRIR